jgi:hypothetical protein
VALVFGFATATRLQALVYLLSIAMWAAANLVRYQLWEMDNIKLLYDAWIPIAVPFVAQYILFFLRRARARRHATAAATIAAALLVTATFSGAACVLLTVTAPIEILGHEDADFGMWTAEATPIDAMFLVRRNETFRTRCVRGSSFERIISWSLDL